MSTDDLPVAERFERWLEHVSRTVAPVRATCDDRARFRAVVDVMDLGAVHLSTQAVSACRGRRTAAMIRQSDPEMFHLLVNTYGHSAIEQNGRRAVLRPSDLVLYHTSRPFHFETGLNPTENSRGLMLTFPGTLLPIAHRKVEQLAATAFSGREGIGSLLSGFLLTLSRSTQSYGQADLGRLGTVLTDLITAFLAHQLDEVTTISEEAGRQSMLLRIYAYIQAHLADPALSPAGIAAAHHMSLRTLHRLFESEEDTVAGRIRAWRLDRCRRDLLDPALAGRPIRATALRWGFRDVTGFSRAFRATYGLNPKDYRQRHR
ncbi:helix-turn-helix domain-containing protein [Nonomuraea jiangxiensis]|uniref:AraC-type DNA-binding protein n=1 Tax=Nonomuraea jiangxiensis TaxID=633440 RepID=A0A1G8PY51_9ACTN|nr:helix-turn-helix domain-containing protein [Nonomuraea jiangxiensis]SDI96760.1 AraC-type DNA-binding protein [Nonomuraea jiangxiensis]